MPKPLKAMQDLLRELDEVRELGRMTAEPSVAHASLLVARALATLNQLAGHRRGAHEHAPQWEAGAEAAMAEARAALATARKVVGRSRALREQSADEATPGHASARADSLSSRCATCGRSFVVEYTSRNPGSVVAFLVECPWEDCDSMSEVSCPADSIHMTTAARDSE